jgi:hypothetical protein
VDVSAKYGIHHPGFKVGALYATHGAIIFHTQKQFATLEIGQRDDLFRRSSRLNSTPEFSPLAMISSNSDFSIGNHL